MKLRRNGGTYSRCLYLPRSQVVIADFMSRKHEPISLEEQTEVQEASTAAISDDGLPIDPGDGQENISGDDSPGEVSRDSTESNVPAGNNQQTPYETSAPGANTPAPASTPTPSPTLTPAPFHPASCTEIEKAKPDAVSEVFKIYLNGAGNTRRDHAR
jgi:hypothetical protein